MRSNLPFLILEKSCDVAIDWVVRQISGTGRGGPHIRPAPACHDPVAFVSVRNGAVRLSDGCLVGGGNERQPVSILARHDPKPGLGGRQAATANDPQLGDATNALAPHSGHIIELLQYLPDRMDMDID
jgi:hypothetical protein